MNKLLLAVLALTTSFTANAARVAVTDSGTDFSHAWLKNNVLINEKDIAGNLVDDDRNGKVDDVMGWNFVDDYGQIFFPQHLRSVKEDTFHFFEVIARMQAGTQTPEDEEFWKQNFSNLSQEDKGALKTRLNFYGQYAHSTHCSGIIASLAPNAKIMSNRIFPDTPPEAKMEGIQGPADIVYKLLAAITNGIFAKVSPYLKERQIDVANYSVGANLQAIAKIALALKGIKNPTPEQLAAETKRINAQYEPMGRAWMNAAPSTLFVIAAGNDGANNDELPTFPANVKMPNAITVAATLGNASLAKFSNYGANMVEVAAPGVAIESSVPSLDHNRVLAMSGTSMAAPYVTGVAAQMKDINTKLRAEDLKTILMNTVDVKDWLKSKVVSGGTVNPVRAYEAARLSNTMSLQTAIQQAKSTVKDLPVIATPKPAERFADALEFAF